MSTKPPTLAGLGDYLLKLTRHWLGTTNLPRMENTMATVVEALNALAAQQADTSAAQTASFSNLQAAVERLETAVRNGEVSPEIQAAVDELSAGFTAMKDAADKADDGTEPSDPANLNG